LSGELKITSICPKEDGEACKYSWSRLSAIEIIPEDKPKEELTD
jgi:hypothetical protein